MSKNTKTQTQRNMKEEQIELLLKELRESGDIIYKIFTEGSCFRLYPVLKAIYPEAIAWWSDRDNHCAIQIGNIFYDIGGNINADRVKNSYYCIPENELPGYKLMKYVPNEDHRYSVIVDRYKEEKQ